MPASTAFRLSGGAGNTNPAASLGGAMSSTAAAANTIFDTVTSGEASAGDTEYRLIYVLNDGDQVLDSCRVWISDQPTQGTYALALAGEGIDGTAETVANENTAPVGESFSVPTSAATGLECGPLNPGQRRPVWLRRVISAATPGVALASNAAQFRVDYDYVPA